jgi:membrane associated rhomboid family serine protease
MINDRDYFKTRFSAPTAIALKWLLMLMGGVFILQTLTERWFRMDIFTYAFALSKFGLTQGYLWQVITYSFLHVDFLHLVLNGLTLFLVGQSIQAQEGSVKLVFIYITAAIGGALLWLGINISGNSELMGASAAAFGLVTYFCCMQVDKPITFFLFLFIPVTVRPKVVLLMLFGFEALNLIFSEILLADARIASSAHLGGMLAGFLSYHFFQKSSFQGFALFKKGMPESDLPSWFKKSKKAYITPKIFKLNMQSFRCTQCPRASAFRKS